MAHFNGGSYEDIFREPADILYENTLSKTVGLAAEHTHKGALHWTSSGKIRCEAPHIKESYDWVIRILGIDVYLALVKLTHTPFNISLYGYSINISAVGYLNASISTVNFGYYFILPSNNRYQYGRLQVNIRPIQNENGKNVARDLAKGGEKKKGAIYIRDVRQDTTQ